MDWYADRYGAFTYYEDWSGFNVPSNMLEPFYAGKFDPLSKKEERFLGMFRSERKPFYVIGVANDGSHTDILHELAHALYFTNTEYRNAVEKEMRAYDTSKMKRKLAKMGYAQNVLHDEVHAYLATPGGKLEPSERPLAGLRTKLRAIFKRYSADLQAPQSGARKVAGGKREARNPR